MPRALGALFGALLLALSPRVGTTGVERPPEVDLGRWRVEGEHVVAPVRGGGKATLTLDPELQTAAQRLLARARPSDGAVVVVDVRRGRLLAAAEFANRGETGGEILTSARAPAASVFKIVTTAALLRRYVSPTRMVCFHGGASSIDESHLVAARGSDARCSPFRNALGYSRNAVYAQLAARVLDDDGLRDTAEALGFNGEVPFDFPATVGTLELPTGELAFARAAAGFRGSKLSPLGAAHLANIIALKGLASKLHVVESAPGYVAPRQRELLGRVLNGSIAVELRRMMEVTVHSGTSLEAFSAPSGRSYLGDIRVAGKTGTLQQASGHPTTMWFTGFAPSRDPEIVVAVMLNNGRVWRRRANEVARDVFRAYFARRGRRGVTHPFDE